MWFRQEEASKYPNDYDVLEASSGSVEELISILPKSVKMRRRAAYNRRLLALRHDFFGSAPLMSAWALLN
jgi:hypothetical protein